MIYDFLSTVKVRASERESSPLGLLQRAQPKLKDGVFNSLRSPTGRLIFNFQFSIFNFPAECFHPEAIVK